MVALCIEDDIEELPYVARMSTLKRECARGSFERRLVCASLLDLDRQISGTIDAAAQFDVEGQSRPMDTGAELAYLFPSPHHPFAGGRA